MRTVLEPFGGVCVTIDSKEVEYAMIPLETAGEATGYAVDFRGKMVLPLPASNADVVVTCTLENESQPVFEGGSDTGENLSAVTFDFSDHRLTIGTIGDLPDRDYDYLRNGLRVVMKPCARAREITFCIAEKRLHGDADSADTWLAVDIW